MRARLRLRVTVTDDTARGLAEKRSQAAYDEYMHLGCYAFFSSRANEAMRGAHESLSTDSATMESKASALAELRACYRTHLATEEATRSRLGYLKLAKNGPTDTEADRVFAVLAHANGQRAEATPAKPAPTESAEKRKQREQAASARKAATTAATADKAKAKVTK
eukprot:jgi/Tetstr1/457851/TSEL_004253.t1